MNDAQEAVAEKLGYELSKTFIAAQNGDANAALLLVEHMRKEGKVIRLDNGLDSTWEATFYDPQEAIYAPAQTLPLAICKAFAAANKLTICLQEVVE